ncbi:helix-turn-helix transcriptional regulator [Streptomyces sp. ME03-5684b]|uniref:helix-turn-helix domain-containing protein n=1 Tax=Streptomyces sp. ME03-5684b TaxID=3028681 RepID=UPI0029B0C355|nr:helix-turn-helix transcriptional regulator [Streptomyces sp. ME03-5684b]MDX3319701.1 helix-turn-helix transcriptional regulator [Streptomyces sp. ME03-5684b]
MSVQDASAGKAGPVGGRHAYGDGVPTPWAEFGAQLRYCRRRLQLTQRQLGRLVGYHHSLISKWESGTREPTAGVVSGLERVLNAQGVLSPLAGAGDERGCWPPTFRGAAFSGPLPGGGEQRLLVPDRVVDHWPEWLDADGCALHAGDHGCAVPPFGDLVLLPDRLRQARVTAAPAVAEADLVHLVLALLDRCEHSALRSTSTTVLGAVEQVLRSLAAWAEAADVAQGPPLVLMRIAARYAQLAGRLRMQRGQGALAMAWVAHGLRWAEAAGDTITRVTLTTDLCTLARLDGDGPSALGYAQALAGLGAGGGWIATLAHMYLARGYAATGDGAECRRRASLSRSGLDGLGGRDLAQAPWLADGQGQLRVESAVAGGLRDLAVLTGDRATARGAARAAVLALEQVPAGMLPTRLLLTLRLADCHAGAGELDAALELAAPVVEQAVAARRRTISHELAGLHGHLTGTWGGLREVRDFQERIRAARADAGA